MLPTRNPEQLFPAQSADKPTQHRERHSKTFRPKTTRAMLRVVSTSLSVLSLTAYRYEVSTTAPCSAQPSKITNSSETSMLWSRASYISARLVSKIGPTINQKQCAQAKQARGPPGPVQMAEHIPQMHIIETAVARATPQLPTCNSCPEEVNWILDTSYA